MIPRRKMSCFVAVVWVVLTFACSKTHDEKAKGQYRDQLFNAVAAGDTDKVAGLLSKIRDINVRNPSGYTPLHWAVLTQREQIASLLISRGADVNAAPANGYTPLHDAAFGGYAKIASLLVGHGANVYAADKAGKIPLDVAVEKGHGELVPLLKPLHVAAAGGDFSGVKAILERNPKSLDARDERGWSSLHLAVKNGHLEIVKLLIDRGADINARGPFGITPLRAARANNRNEAAACLVEKGAWDQSDTLLLGKKLAKREAIIWHLFYTGWVIKTQSCLLIYDYLPLSEFALPATIPACLANGEIDPAQIKNLKVVVLAPVVHDQRQIDTLFSWKKSIKDITYILGADKVKDRAARYIAPQQRLQLPGLEILTIRSNGLGEGFAVTVDGLTIFLGGDHDSGSGELAWNLFTKEIDFLAGQVSAPDLAIMQMLFEERVGSSKGILYTLEKLRPKVMFPNCAVAATSFYKKFVAAAVFRHLPTKIRCAAKRGDLFFYPEDPPRPSAAR